MDYKKINDREIEINPGETPIQELLETIAKVSYELARPVGNGIFAAFATKSEDIDYSRFVSSNGVDMDYVNGRQCKTSVSVNENGTLTFDASLYQTDRGSPELFLDKVKSTLEGKVEGAETNVESDKPDYWDRVEIAAAQYGVQIDPNNARQARLNVALALDKNGRPNEAIEIMTGKDFDPNGMDAVLLVGYKMGGDSPEKFYSGFANIDY